MRIGVLGGGQLGQMMGLAGIPLGMEFRFWDPSQEATAAAVGELYCKPFDDEQAVDAFIDGVDVVTYEFENVPVKTLERLQEHVQCRPGIRPLLVSQDRVFEKQFFAQSGVPVGPWQQVDSEEDLLTAFGDLGNSIVKTRRFGYDGKGQRRIASLADCRAAWADLGGQPLILEKLVPFDRELSLIGVRSATGDFLAWPLVENLHRQGILHRTIAPAPNVSDKTQSTATGILRSIMEALDYVGVLTVELFAVGDDLFANEMAPRVHNSGHWTIEGAVTSQFENHVRAICGLPLGSTAQRFPSVMLNCIGAMPNPAEVLTSCGGHLHDYGKSPREGRKVGHLTICDEPGAKLSLEERSAAAEELICRDKELSR